MIYKTAIFLFLMLNMIGCKNSNRDEPTGSLVGKSVEKNVPSESEIKKEIISDTFQLSSFLPIETKKSSIEILTIKKEIDSTSVFFMKFKSECSLWNLDSGIIRNILSASKSIDGNKFHYFYNVLPCSYEGKANFYGKKVSYKVNSGSFAIVIYKDTSVYLGYEGEKYKKYFLSSAGLN